MVWSQILREALLMKNTNGGTGCGRLIYLRS
jgi:hypothetical protein